jgi:hypothetical protein
MPDDSKGSRWKVESFGPGAVWFDETLGMMRVAFQLRAVVTLREAKEQVEAMRRLKGDAMYPALVDMRNVLKCDKAARDYYAGLEYAKLVTACGMLTGGNGVGVAIGNFFIAIYGKKVMPIKLFSKEADAIAWLSGFLGTS